MTRRRATRTTTPRKWKMWTRPRRRRRRKPKKNQGGDPRVGPPQRAKTDLDAQAGRSDAGGVRRLLQVADKRLGGPRGGQALLGGGSVGIPVGPLRPEKGPLRHVRGRK